MPSLAFATTVGVVAGAGAFGAGYHVGRRSHSHARGAFERFAEGIGSLAEGVLGAFADIASSVEALVTPTPEVELRELRDLAREHNLDRVERGPARIERDDGSLIATWSGEELTRFREYQEQRAVAGGGSNE